MSYESDRLLITRLGQINLIQRGTIAIADPSSAQTNTATITAVTTARSVLYHLGNRRAGTGTSAGDIGQAAGATLELTNSTTVTATVANTVAGGVTTSYQVVEYAA